MRTRRRDRRTFVDQHLYDTIDLLVVDEAGQATPDVAGASFALARGALVIGDTEQIEPIWNVPRAVCRATRQTDPLTT
jgi:superfamily I DNA and/or RNA helicase